ncbi:MAG: YigZ family protein [Clostridiales bacterium]|nr:YigZ family protein [Clostridiales bacterium]
MVSEYLTVLGEAEATTVIERSKFICYIKGVKDEADARDFIDKIKKIHSLATHNCYAYIADDLGLVQKFSDDGEPQGTAGMPMLDVLKNKKLYKTVAVVTRYFGGVKLGTGGLVRAYGGAVADCIEKTKIVTMRAVKNYLITADYDGYSKLLKAFNSENYKIVNTVFADRITLTIAVTLDSEKVFIDKLNDLFKGNPKYEYLGESYGVFN